ncbi:MAG: acetolactate synthase 3 large subunit [Alphaproteobacteria bacterium]|nr:acetolactate synthase 3 large subunit [Alphaproteobacteria bacterium]
MYAETALARSQEPAAAGALTLSGAQIVIRALKEQGVTHIFGYPGGAVLPIYDALFESEGLTHVLCRHEQGAAHAAEGYARSTGKPGVVLVTSGPGATNAVTGLTDALMDSIPVVMLSGQVATHLIGTDAFQECDTVGITRPCTKHNWLVKDVNQLARTIHQAFQIATSGRPGPVVVDIPKDVQVKSGAYESKETARHPGIRPKVEPELASIVRAVDMMAAAKKPIFYTGGGIINAGPDASRHLRELVKLTGFPVTSTLMGLGAIAASDPQWLGMLGMHGTFEANQAMHDCDLMICIGARFDDRVTGRIDAFSPHSKKIHIDIDASQINKIVRVDLAIIADAGRALKEMLHFWKTQNRSANAGALAHWWKEIETWRARRCLEFRPSLTQIKPQLAIDRLYAATRGRDLYITTEVGQHQMWAAQRFGIDGPNRWMTSGGLGTMGYGLPAAIGVQAAHPDALVIDIAGEASVQMTIQEMSTAVQYNLPIKVFILNNEWMGMVRQWQQLLHGERYSHSYSAALPDFVKLAEAYGCVGLRCSAPDELDEKIAQMIEVDAPVLFDCRVDPKENVYPMIPSGAAHNEMILSDADEEATAVDEDGKMLV